MSEEYDEVYDFKKIGIVIGVIGIVAIIVIFFAGLFTESLSEFMPVMEFPVVELPVIDFTEEEISPIINEIIQKGDESKLISNNIVETPIPETRTKNELLIIEFIRLGLQEEEITDVLTDDCSNYQNSTTNEFKFQKLFDVKKEICFGVEGD